jgi:hypothetical protein
MTIDHGRNVASRKINAPAGFQWFAWEVVGDGVLMTGCVSTGTVTRGPNKGRPRYDGERVKCFVSRREVAEEEARFERETGKCGNCGGDGQEFARWSAAHGTEWRTCRRCEGTGIGGGRER